MCTLFQTIYIYVYVLFVMVFCNCKHKSIVDFSIMGWLFSIFRGSLIYKKEGDNKNSSLSVGQQEHRERKYIPFESREQPYPNCRVPSQLHMISATARISIDWKPYFQESEHFSSSFFLSHGCCRHASVKVKAARSRGMLVVQSILPSVEDCFGITQSITELNQSTISLCEENKKKGRCPFQPS
ncbi:hypothetical protein MUK42_35574, partial [Musa troglodytarum]